MIVFAGVIFGICWIIAATFSGRYVSHIPEDAGLTLRLIGRLLRCIYYALAASAYLFALLFAFSAAIWLLLKGYGALPGAQLVPIIDPPTLVDFAIYLGAGVFLMLLADSASKRIREKNILY